MFREKYHGVFSNGEISVEIDQNPYGIAIVYLDGVEYAVIDNLHDIDVLDEFAVCDWVNETHYDNDYPCPAYEPCRLNAHGFECKPLTDEGEA
jgi:hypothetical protein